VTGFESIIDQKQPIRILKTLLSSEHIPHALLFTGIEGVGKHTAAVTFAMACNCSGLDSGQLSADGTNLTVAVHNGQQPVPAGPCGNCRSCKKIQSGNHPDILSIQPTGSSIKIDQIRSLYRMLSMKPYEAKYRVVILSGAQHMNTSASNAFLKMLEEPPGQTLFILIAAKKSDLIQTVVSRCQHIRFHPISRKDLVSALLKEEIVPEDADVLAAMSKGSLSKALHMNQTGWMNHRNWLINVFGLDKNQSMEDKSAGFFFSLSAYLTENKADLDDNLETVLSWLRDLMLIKYQSDKIIHKDLLETIKIVSKKNSTQSLLHKIKAVQRAQSAIRRPNTNIRLVLDILMKRLAEAVNQEELTIKVREEGLGF